MLQLNNLVGFGAKTTNGYFANAVNFDGTNDYLTHGSGLTGAGDSKRFTMTGWLKAAADGTHMRILNGSNRVYISRFTSNQLRISVSSSVPVISLFVVSSDDTMQIADGWVNFLTSFDMADTGKRHLYINDSSDLNVTTYNNATLDLDVASWGFGADASGAGNKVNGDMADFMFWDGVYIDFSTEANRRLFIDAGGKPVDPDAASGAVATLGTPRVRFTNPTATWHTNAGSGGGFTENGALTIASPP